MGNAIQAIYRDLEYATTLTRQRASVSSTPFTPTGTDGQGVAEDESEDIEEAWTFVDDDTDPDAPKKEAEFGHLSVILQRDPTTISPSGTS